MLMYIDAKIRELYTILSCCCSAGCLATAISWKVSSAVSVSSCQLTRASSTPDTAALYPCSAASSSATLWEDSKFIESRW